MNPAVARNLIRALALLLPPCAMLGSRGTATLAVTVAWLAGMLAFWQIAAGPGAILVLLAMLIAPVTL